MSEDEDGEEADSCENREACGCGGREGEGEDVGEYGAPGSGYSRYMPSVYFAPFTSANKNVTIIGTSSDERHTGSIPFTKAIFFSYLLLRALPGLSRHWNEQTHLRCQSYLMV